MLVFFVTGAETNSASTAAVQGSIQTISSDWQAADKRKLDIASATASASLGELYLPGRIHDGNRRTKWVSPIKPASTAPQWIQLVLAGGAQEVSAVAVFGERIGNDAILDADVQVESEGKFQTVASVRNAASGSWLASFAPLRTGKVRLLVTRSSGPSDHTDVFEVEIYGRPLSAAEAKAHLASRQEYVRQCLAQSQQALDNLGPGLEQWPAVFRTALEQARAQLAESQEAWPRWDGLDDAMRTGLMQRMEEDKKAVETLQRWLDEQIQHPLTA